MRSFSLKQFGTPPDSSQFRITGFLRRHFNELSIAYEVSGDTRDLIFPDSSGPPLRKTGLWESTCFEFFLSPEDAGHYWEFNLSPAGHWNVYRFASYRQGMKEEQAISSLPFAVTATENILRLSMKFNLDGIIPPAASLKIGISGVIKSLNEGITYWALAHTGPKADFHRKDNFIIDL